MKGKPQLKDFEHFGSNWKAAVREKTRRPHSADCRAQPC